MIFAEDSYGIFHMAEYSLMLGASSRKYLLAPARARTSSPSMGSELMPDLLSEFPNYEAYNSTWPILTW